jgi:hypothetical protein
LRAQFVATRDAAFRLVYAHIELAKAEAAAIAGEVAQVAALIAVAVAAVLLAVNLLIVGLSLFLGEWLLGSIGWGILHGILLFIAIAVASAFVAIGQPVRGVGIAFVTGVLVAIAVAVVLALQLPNRAYEAIGTELAGGVETGVRPLAVGAAIWAVVGFAIAVAGAFRASGAGTRFLLIVSGLVLGGLFGAFTAITFGPHVSAGIGITVGYLTWIIVMGIAVARNGIDVEALQARFTPTATIDTTKETLEWLQTRLPPGIGS